VSTNHAFGSPCSVFRGRGFPFCAKLLLYPLTRRASQNFPCAIQKNLYSAVTLPRPTNRKNANSVSPHLLHCARACPPRPSRSGIGCATESHAATGGSLAERRTPRPGFAVKLKATGTCVTTAVLELSGGPAKQSVLVRTVSTLSGRPAHPRLPGPLRPPCHRQRSRAAAGGSAAQGRFQPSSAALTAIVPADTVL
jgi:hypothetical protein